MSKQRWNVLVRLSLKGVSVFYLLCTLQGLRARSHCSSWTGTCPSAEAPPTFLTKIKHPDGQRWFPWRCNSGSFPFSHGWVSASTTAQVPVSLGARNFFQGVTCDNSHKNPSAGSFLTRNEHLQHKKALTVFFTSFAGFFSTPQVLNCAD